MGHNVAEIPAQDDREWAWLSELDHRAQIAGDHGELVAVDSQSRSGTCVRFSLPVRPSLERGDS